MSGAFPLSALAKLSTLCWTIGTFVCPFFLFAKIAYNQGAASSILKPSFKLRIFSSHVRFESGKSDWMVLSLVSSSSFFLFAAFQVDVGENSDCVLVNS